MRKTKYARALRHLEWDAAIIAASILAAVYLVEIGVFKEFLNLSQSLHLIAAFVAGIFFTSTFTIAPAAVALAEIGFGGNVIMVALFGAAGAVCGDLVLFLFIRDAVADDLRTVIKARSYKKLVAFFRGGLMRFVAPVLGALIIASPLPDEFGLAIMGMSRMRTWYLIPIAFVMNFFGIWAIISVAQML